MPAPTVAEIENNLKLQYIASGLYPKTSIQTINGQKVIVSDPTSLPDALNNQIHIQALAWYQTWETWQTTQVVSPIGIPIPMNVSAVPVTGTGMLP